MTAFFNAVIPFIPEKLYRFRKLDNNGYSVKSFLDGSITLCKASLFPDKYDSLVFVDNKRIRDELVKYLKEALSFVLKDIEHNNPLVKAEKASRVLYYRECGLSDQQIVAKIIAEEYADYVADIERSLKKREMRFRDSDKTARIACFTENIRSKFMWDTYAGGYTGFALEYNLRAFFVKCLHEMRQVYVFPVIYTDTRPDLTDLEFKHFIIEQSLVREEMKVLGPYLRNLPFNLVSPFRPYLYKDRTEYAHEREWRMLYYDVELTSNYISIPDADCLTGIYYGPDIKKKDESILQSVANDKGIQEHRVQLDTENRRFDLSIVDY